MTVRARGEEQVLIYLRIPDKTGLFNRSIGVLIDDGGLRVETIRVGGRSRRRDEI